MVTHLGPLKDAQEAKYVFAGGGFSQFPKGRVQLEPLETYWAGLLLSQFASHT